MSPFPVHDGMLVVPSCAGTHTRSCSIRATPYPEDSFKDVFNFKSVCVCYPWKPEESIRSERAGVMDSCEPAHVDAGN